MKSKRHQYESLLLQLRLVADQNHDHRSLVAIAAQFERDIEKTTSPPYMKQAVKAVAYCRRERRGGTGEVL